LKKYAKEKENDEKKKTKNKISQKLSSVYRFQPGAGRTSS